MKIRMRTSISAACLAMALGAGPASARITNLSFTGKGAIDYARDGFAYGYPINAPAVNTPVTVTGIIHLGGTGFSPPLPDDFTGSLIFNDSDLRNRIDSFRISVAGAGLSAVSGRNVAYQGGRLTFHHGRLVDFVAYVDYDPDVHQISTRNFFFGAGSATWGGHWSVVPEPASWAMMIAGFGLVGATMRRRRRVTAAAVVHAIRADRL